MKSITQIRKHCFTRSFIIALLFFVFNALNCTRDNSIMNISGEWTSDIPFIINHANLEIPHDNRIFETDNFLVFSDGSSDDVKKEFARKAERALREILSAFNIKRPADIGIQNQESKITIYTKKRSTHSQLAFPYGFLLYGQDSQNYFNWPAEMKPRFYNEVKHETVHVVQFLLGVLPNPEHREREPDRWFNEGIAEYISGGFFIPITTKANYQIWRRGKGHVNPISIHKWSDLPIPSTQVGEYYPMFGLAVKYLVDSKGLGKTLEDVKMMFISLAENDIDFATAFEQHLGLSLKEYENTFFERMDNYLK